LFWSQNTQWIKRFLLSYRRLKLVQVWEKLSADTRLGFQFLLHFSQTSIQIRTSMIEVEELNELSVLFQATDDSNWLSLREVERGYSTQHLIFQRFLQLFFSFMQSYLRFQLREAYLFRRRQPAISLCFNLREKCTNYNQCEHRHRRIMDNMWSFPIIPQYFFKLSYHVLIWF